MAVIATGAKARIIIKTSDQGNIPIAFAASISISHENHLEEIPQLDSLEVAEYAENGHRCSFTVGFFKLLEIDSTTYFFDSSDLTTLLIQPELEFEVISEENGEEVILYTMRGVKFEGGSGQVSAEGIWEGEWNFKARRGIGI